MVAASVLSPPRVLSLQVRPTGTRVCVCTKTPVVGAKGQTEVLRPGDKRDQMCGMGHLAWVICLLTVSQLVRSSAAQGFIYTKDSCLDLVPRHRDTLKMDEKKEEPNHVKEPTDNTTTTTNTTTTKQRPPAAPEVTMYSGDVQVKVMTSEDNYRRLKTLVVTLQSASYFNGFMLQARKVSGNKEIVGRFMEVPHRAEYLTCPNGTENTVVHQDAPLRLSNLSFTWMAPETDLGPIEFVASVLLNSATQYKEFKSGQLKLSLYPVSTKECAVAKSCFRYCMKNGGHQCKAHMSRYMATLEYMDKKTKVKITIGGQLPESDGYLALGFSKDRHRLSDADINVCYRDDADTVGVEHYLLADINHPPDLHLGELKLDSSDVDGDYVWCSFVRPLTGQDNDLLNLKDPHYYFYFWGMRNASNIFMPSSNHIKSSGRMMSLKDDLFNQIAYSGSRSHRRVPYTIVAAAILLLGVHFLCW
ncbi:putative ferric-chelate reductase 1 isoform X1 [Homarus americanus]|uniref:putative ferric-chelate reductase 1 isoform X1 n=1 Tax=Homarus americanus TaxID=6706 RepID=UPI001C44D438|nr:putative ferric-chelate reductase 1 isoform X1 [Homarus americanus]